MTAPRRRRFFANGVFLVVVGGVQVVFELLAYGRGHPRNTVAVIVLAAARRRSRHVARRRRAAAFLSAVDGVDAANAETFGWRT